MSTRNSNLERVDLLPRLLQYDSWAITAWKAIVGFLETELADVAELQRFCKLRTPQIASGRSYFLQNDTVENGRSAFLQTELQKMVASALVDDVSQQLEVRLASKANTFFAATPLGKKNGENGESGKSGESVENGDGLALPAESFSYGFVSQIAFKYGVTDNEGAMALQALSDYIAHHGSSSAHIVFNKVYSARLIFFSTNFINWLCGQTLLTGQTILQQNVEDELLRIAQHLFANPLIEDVQIKSFAALSGGNVLTCPSVSKKPTFVIKKNNSLLQEIEIIGHSIASLQAFTNNRHLFFSKEELEAIVAHYSKAETQTMREQMGLPINPTDIEMEVLAQTWSEHCKHKIFSAKVFYKENDDAPVIIDSLFKETIKNLTSKISKNRNDLLSVFSDNAGIVRFNSQYAYCCKVETHNAPSMLDPFGGAITGIVGVNRDIIGAGMGFKPIFNLNVLCFANPMHNKSLPPRVFHPARLLKGVHAGIREGGNQSGIPTVGGALWFHPTYLARPLVFCGTIGFAPLLVGNKTQAKPIETKEIMDGDYVVMVGGLVGRDGIHGATSSSQVMSEVIPSSMVQIADPITQKKALDFILAARNKNLFRAITDNGAGGLSSSVGEMATLCGGASVDVARVPLKEEGLQPWEIFVSESQERMTLAVNPSKWPQLASLAKQFDCLACNIGNFNTSGKLSVTYGKKLLASLPLSFLHDGLPQLQLTANWQPPLARWEEWKKKMFAIKKKAGDSHVFWHSIASKKVSDEELLHRLLKRPNIASKEALVRQYDHEVQGRTVLKPLDGIRGDAPMDAAVVRPLFNDKKALAAASGGAPRYATIDAGAMAAAAVDEAVRNLLCVGANTSEAVGLDNFCWPNPLPSQAEDNPRHSHNMAQLVRACYALKRVCSAYNIPLVSGKDSMKNDYRSKELHLSIVPTLLFTAVAPVDNCENIVSSAVQTQGASIYLLGNCYDEMGESEHHYALYGEHVFAFSEDRHANKIMQNSLAEHGGVSYALPSSWPHPDFSVPLVREKENIKNYYALQKCITSGLITAAHDLSEGGLAVAAAEMCFGNRLGLTLDVNELPLFPGEENFFDRGISQSSVKLFSESNGRILLEVKKENEGAFLQNMKNAAVFRLGHVADGGVLKITAGRNILLTANVDDMLASFQQTFRSF